jgi:hypothetical protein
MGAARQAVYSGAVAEPARFHFGDRNGAPSHPLILHNRRERSEMPRYFFHVREQSQFSRDAEGQELANLDAARREAVSIAREMIGERVLHGGAIDGRIVEIADEQDHILDEIRFDDVLFEGGTARSYGDDVTKSAPVTNPIR